MVLNRGAEAPLETALELERKAYAWLRSTHDYAEGVTAFLESGRRSTRGVNRGPVTRTILANRAVVLGAVKVADLLDLAVQAEGSGFFDAVWAGDSLLAKPRLESVTLLSALAGVTSKLRLGVGCMGDLRAPPSGDARPSVGEPRRPLGWPIVARGVPGRTERGEQGPGRRARRHEHPLRRARRSSGRGHRRAAHALRRQERLAPGPVLHVPGRDARAAARAAAVPHLDRVQPDRSHLEGQGLGLRGGRRALVQADRAPCRRLDDEQALAGRVPTAVAPHHGDGARGGPRPASSAARSTTTSTSPRTGRRGSRRPRPFWTRITPRSSRASSSSSGRSRADRSSAPRSSPPTSRPAWATWRCASAPGTRWANSSAS